MKTWSKFTLHRKILLIAFVPFVLMSLSVAALLVALTDAERVNQNEQLRRKLLYHDESLVRSIMQSATMLSMYFRNHDKDAKNTIINNQVAMKNEWRQMMEISSGDANTRSMIEPIGAELTKVAELLDETLLTEQKRNITATTRLLTIKDEAIDTLAKLKSDLTDLRTHLTTGTALDASTYRRAIERITVGLLLGSIALSFAIATALSTNISRRLTKISRRLDAAGKFELPKGATKRGDEIDDVDRALSEMAQRVVDATLKMKQAIEQAGDVILWCAPDGKISGTNSAAQRWDSRERLAMRSVLDLIPQREQEQFSHILSDVSNSGESRVVEATVLMPDGAEVCELWSIHWSARERQLFAVVHDLTQRKQIEKIIADAEAEQRRTMDLMPAGVCLVAPDGNVQYANSAAMDLCRRSTNDFGSAFTQFMHLDSQENVVTFLQYLCTQSRAQEISLEAEGQQPKMLQVRFFPFALGTAPGALAIVVDRTEQWQLQQLRQRLTAMIAHDIATPLMNINSTLQMAQDGMLGKLDTAGSAEVDEALTLSQNLMASFNNLVKFDKFMAQQEGASNAALADLVFSVVSASPVNDDDSPVKIEIEDSGEQCAFFGEQSKVAFLFSRTLDMLAKCCNRGAVIRIRWRTQPNGSILWTATADKVHTNVFENTARETSEQPASHVDALSLIVWKALLKDTAQQSSVRQIGSEICVSISLTAAGVVAAPLETLQETTRG